MDTTMFDAAQAKYDAGDFEGAYRAYADAYRKAGSTLKPGQVGYAAHMMGNCLMKIKRYPEAERMYRAALADGAYGKVGALNVNLGTALTATKNYEAAADCFNAALADPNYPTPYKALTALGNAQLKLGRPAEAGTSYRNAALEPNNPDPGRSLVNLGVCFMALNRPSDAVESYVTALEFEKDPIAIDKIYANLGQAYVATGRMHEAVNAFEKATEDGNYKLSDAAFVDYDRAKSSVEADSAHDEGLDSFDNPYATVAGQPLEEEPSAQFAPAGSVQDDYAVIPPADDTGFFTMTEDEMNEIGRADMRKKRKSRNIVPKIILVLAVLILAAVIAAGVLFWKGYGYPMSETVVQDMFTAHAADQDVTPYWAPGDEAAINAAMSSVAKTSNITIDSIERNTNDTVAHVTATLNEGGQVHYDVYLARDGISWKITDIQLVFSSQQTGDSADGGIVSMPGSSSGDQADGAENPDAAAAPAEGEAAPAEGEAAPAEGEAAPAEEAPAEEAPAEEVPVEGEAA